MKCAQVKVPIGDEFTLTFEDIMKGDGIFMPQNLPDTRIIVLHSSSRHKVAVHLDIHDSDGANWLYPTSEKSWKGHLFRQMDEVLHIGVGPAE